MLGREIRVGATPRQGMPPGSPARTAVDKAFEILAALPSGGATAGVTELARDLRLSKSTAFRLLAVMERHGFVERHSSRYRLGRRLHDIGAKVYEPVPGRLHDILIPCMAFLYEESRETVHLGILVEGEIALLGRLHGARPTPPMLALGSRFPAHSSALGKAILAHSPDETERLIARGLSPRTPQTIVDAEAFREELHRIRVSGIATSRGEARPNVSCMAVALLDSAERPVAALSLTASSKGLLSERYEGLLRRVAVEAQRAIRLHSVPSAIPRRPDPVRVEQPCPDMTAVST